MEGVQLRKDDQIGATAIGSFQEVHHPESPSSALQCETTCEPQRTICRSDVAQDELSQPFLAMCGSGTQYSDAELQPTLSSCPARTSHGRVTQASTSPNATHTGGHTYQEALPEDVSLEEQPFHHAHELLSSTEDAPGLSPSTVFEAGSSCGQQTSPDTEFDSFFDIGLDSETENALDEFLNSEYCAMEAEKDDHEQLEETCRLQAQERWTEVDGTTASMM